MKKSVLARALSVAEFFQFHEESHATVGLLVSEWILIGRSTMSCVARMRQRSQLKQSTENSVLPCVLSFMLDYIWDVGVYTMCKLYMPLIIPNPKSEVFLQNSVWDASCLGSAVISDDRVFVESFDGCSCFVLWQIHFVIWTNTLSY